MMKNVNTFYGLMILYLLISCKSPNEESMQRIRAIDVFKTYITGDFNNAKQIEAQRSRGEVTHPFAVHVNRVADTLIRNAPEVDGFWILEESYYTWEGKKTEIKPYLFLFEAVGDTAVKLTPFNWPIDAYKPEEIRNDNDRLVFDFQDLALSPSFQPATYAFDGEIFTIYAPNDLGNGMTFTLIETFYPDRLEVMELLEKEGKRLTPYTEPIIYDRID